MAQSNRKRNAAIIDRLQRAGHDVALNYTAGRPRVESRDGSRDISPRLTENELNCWLDGYLAACDQITAGRATADTITDVRPHGSR